MKKEKEKETFASVLQTHAYQHDLRLLFDDLLTPLLCSFSQNFNTGKSYDEDLYLKTIAKYPKEMSKGFSKLLALLILEMEERVNSDTGNDVLGEFYELNFCRKGAGQFFTPWHVCLFMAKCVHVDTEGSERKRILDPTCGSGRMLLASSKAIGPRHAYYGIDIDHTCVKMTALNLFLNGIFDGEVMWADALSPDDFRMSYRLSFLPLGIFRIEDKEQSLLWRLHQNTFNRKSAAAMPGIVLPSDESNRMGKGSQMQLF